MPRSLSSLESATLNVILTTMDEADGWLDLTRVCSRTGRHLADVRECVARLVRYKMIAIDESAPNNKRWIRFVHPEASVNEA